MAKGLTDDLDNAKKVTHKRISQIDDWLEFNPDKREDLIDALVWYSNNRSNRFGWRLLYETLKKREGWEDLPGNYQCLVPWAKTNLPDLY
jgi:hypothetical protein|tara:strand:+ start:1803 stop:2072 length:270 start_codon:yes stop_codon:yes gene_type:complete